MIYIIIATPFLIYALAIIVDVYRAYRKHQENERLKAYYGVDSPNKFKYRFSDRR